MAHFMSYYALVCETTNPRLWNKSTRPNIETQEPKYKS